MPAAGRLADIGSGHGCFPPSPTVEGSGDVFTNHRPALRKGDAVLPHGCGKCPPHGRNVSAGSATVNINNKPAARVGDAVSCGGAVSTGSGDVVIGDDTWGTGTGEVNASVRFVLTKIPGSTAHGYYKEAYTLYHNGSVVQKGRTDEYGVIEFTPQEVSGEFMIEAINHKWRLDVRGLAPADTDAGVQDRLQAMGYHIAADTQNMPGHESDRMPVDVGWFQNARNEEKQPAATDILKALLKGLMP